jgi:hypothetical protein
VDRVISFICDDSENWRATIDTFTIKNKRAICFLITTPGYKLDSLAYKLFREPDNKCLYKRIYINYEKCLDTMLDRKSIELMKSSSPSFANEYDLKWGAYYGVVRLAAGCTYIYVVKLATSSRFTLLSTCALN